MRWLRAQPDQQSTVRDNYFDLPVQAAAERYCASEEFGGVVALIGEGGGRSILDLGAGNGIVSYSLARHGWRVTAVEPDPSAEIGAGAIRGLADGGGLTVSVIEGRLPLSVAGESFDGVVCREVLHHLDDLPGAMRELARLLRPGGFLLAWREPVVDDAGQLAQFLESHPLHHKYGGENAFSLGQYVHAIEAAGLRVSRKLGHLETIINFYPGSEQQRRELLRWSVRRSLGGAGRVLSALPGMAAFLERRVIARNRSPGRLVTLLAFKP